MEYWNIQPQFKNLGSLLHNTPSVDIRDAPIPVSLPTPILIPIPDPLVSADTKYRY